MLAAGKELSCYCLTPTCKACEPRGAGKPVSILLRLKVEMGWVQLSALLWECWLLLHGEWDGAGGMDTGCWWESRAEGFKYPLGGCGTQKQLQLGRRMEVAPPADEGLCIVPHVLLRQGPSSCLSPSCCSAMGALLCQHCWETV